MNFKFPFFSKKQKIVANTDQIVDAKGRKLSDILKSGGSGGSQEDKVHLEVHGKLATNINIFDGMIFIKAKISLEDFQSIIDVETESLKPFRFDVYADDNDISKYYFSIDSDTYFPGSLLGFFLIMKVLTG